MVGTIPTMRSILIHLLTPTTTTPATQAFRKGAFCGRRQILHQQTTCLFSKLGVYSRKIDRSSRLSTITNSMSMTTCSKKWRGTIAKVTGQEEKQFLGCSMLRGVIGYPENTIFLRRRA
uniref:Putative secreted protein n=1 Tax=Ixodes ricinus TaxID=34613 RepID=A0A090X9G2_IXORI